MPIIGIDARDVYAQRPRGIGKMLLELLKIIPGIETEYEFFLYFEPGDEIRPFSSCRNIREIAIDIKGSRFNLWERLRLPFAIVKDRIDLFHCTSPISAVLFPSPMVVTIHDLIPLKIGDGWSAKAIRRFHVTVARNIKKARKIITVSNYTKKDVIETFNVSEDKIEVIYWAPGDIYKEASRAQLSEVRDKYCLDAPYFLAFGGGSPRKNIKRLIEAFSQFKRDIDTDCRLVVVGIPDWFHNELATLCGELSVEKDVSCYGYLPEEDIPPLLSGAKALVYVPLIEGFGIPVLEAMGCGTPVITSNVSSMPEICGDAAYYLNPRSTEEIVEAFRVFFQDDQLRNEFINCGRKKVLDFSWPETARQVLNVYKAALS